MLRTSIFRTIKKSLGRYLAILAIIALGVGFFAGLRVTEDSMHKTADSYLAELRLYDFRLVSTLGLTEDDVEAFGALRGVASACGSVSADMIIVSQNGSDAVYHAHTLLQGINGVDLVKGRMPEAPDECVLDAFHVPEDMIGQVMRLSDNNSEETFDRFAYDEYMVVGLVNASEYINFQRGTTALAGGRVSGFAYLLADGFTSDYFTEIYLKLPGAHEIHSAEYENAVDDLRPSVEALLEERAELRYDEVYWEPMKELADAKKELADKKQELADAEAEVDKGWSDYRASREEAEAKLADSKAQLDSFRAELDAGWSQLEALKNSPAAVLPEAQMKIKTTEQTLQAQEAAYKESLASYEEAVAESEESFAKAEQELVDAQAEIDDAKPELADAEQEIADAEEALAEIDAPSTYALDRTTNLGYSCFENDIRIVSGVAKVFPLFFFLVAALVCISTMTRMVGEQRTQNGVLKALGYNNFAISSQYLTYAGSASLFGCVIGFLAGSWLMPLVLWKVYRIMYSIDRPAAFVFDLGMFAVCTVLYLICMLGVTYFVCRNDLRTSAAGLMRPAAPEAGKRIFLEYIGFLWKRMKFLHKVSARNILRYKKRMFMMIIGIGGCMALLLTGFGIRDTIQPIVDRQYGEIQLYDATATFLNAPDKEEQQDFRENMEQWTDAVALVHAGSIDILADGRMKSADMVVCGEDMTPFLHLHRGSETVSFPGKGEVVINNDVAGKLAVSVGDTITLRDANYKEMTVRVSGIYENYIGDVLYMTEETFCEGFGAPSEITTAYLKLKEGEDEHEVGAMLLNRKDIASVSIINDLKETVSGMLDSLNLIVLIVLVCAGALAFIVLYNLTNITITERMREIATLKVLGFRSGEQKAYVFRENIILTLISAVCGIPLGLALLQYTMSQIKIDGFFFGCRLAGASYLWSLGLTLLFTVIVDLALSKKLKRINMAEAMKAIE